jgi:lipoprotein-anchoring transpeptidase ErfK/SrfK
MTARTRPMFGLPWRSPMSGSRITPTLLCLAVLAFALADSAGPVLAKAVISIDKSTQQLSVLVDGVPRYRFAVSTGRAGYSTPNGSYRPQWLARTWFSKKYYNSPMPHSIFFHGGYAIHGSYEISRLGGPASHGCIRLHPSNARALYALVQREGLGATTIVVHGSTPVTHSPSIRPRFSPDIDRRPPWLIFGYPG